MQGRSAAKEDLAATGFEQKLHELGLTAQLHEGLGGYQSALSLRQLIHADALNRDTPWEHTCDVG
jgi:hypothetical protein